MYLQLFNRVRTVTSWLGVLGISSFPVNPELRKLLSAYSSPKVYLFPGRHGRGHIHPDSADKILRAALIELRIEGAKLSRLQVA